MSTGRVHYSRGAPALRPGCGRDVKLRLCPHDGKSAGAPWGWRDSGRRERGRGLGNREPRRKSWFSSQAGEVGQGRGWGTQDAFQTPALQARVKGRRRVGLGRGRTGLGQLGQGPGPYPYLVYVRGIRIGQAAACSQELTTRSQLRGKYGMGMLKGQIKGYKSTQGHETLAPTTRTLAGQQSSVGGLTYGGAGEELNLPHLMTMSSFLRKETVLSYM